MAYKGKFQPRNPSKYLGDPTNIIYRSRWELKFMVWLDTHSNVVQWGSEELVIPYRSPIDNRIHRYFPDFIVKKKTPDGRVETVVVEIKPKKETKPPKNPGKKTRKYITEVMTYAKNISKWEAANEYAADRGWNFQVWDEDFLRSLGIKIL
mgnify:CR=1 FL=1